MINNEKVFESEEVQVSNGRLWKIDNGPNPTVINAEILMYKDKYQDMEYGMFSTKEEFAEWIDKMYEECDVARNVAYIAIHDLPLKKRDKDLMFDEWCKRNRSDEEPYEVYQLECANRIFSIELKELCKKFVLSVLDTTLIVSPRGNLLFLYKGFRNEDNKEGEQVIIDLTDSLKQELRAKGYKLKNLLSDYGKLSDAISKVLWGMTGCVDIKPMVTMEELCSKLELHSSDDALNSLNRLLY